ncbi:MAG: class I SAM-dependent methyltransferase, partial [Promethearchaeota archaeon]
MEFYEDFAEKYDRLVSLENRIKRESPFYKKLFIENNIETILDCACGTGQHVILFRKMGYKVKGSDISPSMIRKAKTNLKNLDLKIPIKISDFRNLTKVWNEKFDAVICVGNSLPHLFSNDDILKALGEMSILLNEKGVLILGQRNFDKLVKF